MATESYTNSTQHVQYHVWTTGDTIRVDAGQTVTLTIGGGESDTKVGFILVPGPDPGDVPSLQAPEFIGESEYGVGVVGNPRGTGAVDLVQVHTAADLVPSGKYAFQAGLGSKASGDYSVALGGGGGANTALALASGAIAIGGGTAHDSYCVSIGGGDAADSASIALGDSSTQAKGGSLAIKSGRAFDQSVAINGGVAYAASTAIGPDTMSLKSGAVAIGENAIAAGTRSFAAGYFCAAEGPYSAAFGQSSAHVPVPQTTIAGNVATVTGDLLWGSAFAPNAIFRTGDYVYLLNSDGLLDGGSATLITGVNGTTITLIQPPAGGDGNYALISAGEGATGQRTFGVRPFAVGGDSQTSEWLVSAATSDGTAKRLTFEQDDATTANQIRVFRGQVRSFIIHLVSQKDDGTTRVKVYGITLKNVAGIVSQVGSTTTLASHVDTGASGWSDSIGADNTDKLLKIEATGAVASNIRWLAHVTSTEVAWFPPTS